MTTSTQQLHLLLKGKQQNTGDITSSLKIDKDNDCSLYF